MGVAVKTSLRVTVGLFVTGEVPYDQSLVSRPREKHIRAVNGLASRACRLRRVALFERCSQAGDPAAVALEGATVDELLCHDG